MQFRLKIYLTKILAAFWVTLCAASTRVQLALNSETGVYNVQVDGQVWYESPLQGLVLCIAGTRMNSRTLGEAREVSGRDFFGDWTGQRISFTIDGKSEILYLTFQNYNSFPGTAIATATFPHGVDTSNCGSNVELSVEFPSFNSSGAIADNLNTISWSGLAIENTVAARGLQKLNSNGLDCGPVVSTDIKTGKSLVWSTLNSHKIVPQQTKQNIYSMGIAAAIPSLPSNFSYSIIFSATHGGATATMYEWGSKMQKYYNTTRLPSVTLSNVGYYTDDGAYYYASKIIVPDNRSFLYKTYC